MTEPRRYLTPKRKAELIAKQNRICGCGCGESMQGRRIEFDHKLALALGGDNGLENWAALIAEHHLAKTISEAKARGKVRRIRKKLDPDTPPKPKRAWPSRPLQGRGFPKEHRPMRRNAL